MTMKIESKEIYFRYRLIDRLLRDYETVKTSLIVQKLLEKHDISVGSTTVQRDIRNMGVDLHAPIEYDKSAKAYYYPENVEEIFPAIDLHVDEINALKFYADSLTHYKEIGIFKDFTSAIDKIVDAVRIESSQLKTSERITILPENFPKFRGSDLIPTIIAGFDNKVKFRFTYKRHTSDNEKNHIVTPILLKEYDHLWYLVGKIDEKDFITIFALDRISDFELTTLKREFINGFDYEKYFNHAFGIAVPDREVENVVLEFESWRGNYLISAPIHKTQELISEGDGKMTFSIKVIPFHELHSKILSYGKSVKVISPLSLKEEIKNILQMTLNQYNF